MIAVIGAGHNGLTAAAMLARSGQQVLVLEARKQVGGLAGAARGPSVLLDTARVRPAVVEELGLDLTWQTPPVVHMVAPGTTPRPLSAHGVPGLEELEAWTDQLRPLFASVMDRAAPRIDSQAPLWPLLRLGLDVRGLGAALMLELLRVLPTCVEDWLGERIQDPVARAALMMPALHGVWGGPRSPFTSALWLYHRCTSGREIAGGASALIKALESACTGVEIRCSTPVSSIQVTDRASAVTLADGTEIPVTAVVAACSPRHALLDLVPPRKLPAAVERDARRIRCRGVAAKVDLLLEQRPDIVRLVVADEPMMLERAFDAIKHRRLPDDPPLDLRVVDTADGPVASILVPAGFEQDEPWSDEKREALGQLVERALERRVGSFGGRVMRRSVATPADLAQRYGLPGGHLHHGEVAVDQLFVHRPSPRMSEHRSGIRGLYLASGGVHPGGGLTTGPGWLAARAVLDDQ